MKKQTGILEIAFLLPFSGILFAKEMERYMAAVSARPLFVDVYGLSDENGGPGNVIQSFLELPDLSRVACAYRGGKVGMVVPNQAREIALHSDPDPVGADELIRRYPALSQEQAETIRNLYAEAVVETKRRLIPLFLRHFTPAEIAYRLEMLTSPLGRSIQRKMPLVLTTFLAEMGERLGPRMAAIIDGIGNGELAREEPPAAAEPADDLPSCRQRVIAAAARCAIL